MTTKTDKWLNDIAKDYGVTQGACTGVEIVGRIIIFDETDYGAIEEVLEKIREIGAAEITKQVQL